MPLHAFLNELDLPQYLGNFVENEVGMSQVASLNKDELEKLVKKTEGYSASALTALATTKSSAGARARNWATSRQPTSPQRWPLRWQSPAAAAAAMAGQLISYQMIRLSGNTMLFDYQARLVFRK